MAENGNADDVLNAEISRELRRWKRATSSYGSTYYLSRLGLIAGSALVAGGQALEASGIDVKFQPAIAVISIVVAILASLDTWLRPMDRWRGFMESRDNLADLLVRVRAGMPAPEALKELGDLRRRHRDRNIF